MGEEQHDGPPPLDPEQIARLVGRRLLLGLTYEDAGGVVVEQRQLHGIVERVDRSGIHLLLPDGATFQLPPDLRGLHEAPPGTYRLRSTGEEVENPDFLQTWTITKPSGAV